MRRRNTVTTEVRIGPADLCVIAGVEGERMQLDTVKVDEFGCLVLSFSKKAEAWKAPRSNTVVWPKKARTA